MKDLYYNTINDEELKARQIMAKEWNQFQVPQEIDERITELIYWNEEDEHEVLLKLMDEFEAIECYIQKCLWFSSTNYYKRKEEEAKGAFYQSAFCKDACVPKRFRSSRQDSAI
ncbi:hypothetical protein AAGF08_09735 [Algoriphagus sp. SE2]|uniref:hypothetical protein n=1 Tax=Algoriphagus sp. SE2 TaxID=3141536 RepID=UPI0031CD78D9